MKDYGKRAKERKLKPEEYQGGTTAVSNMGMMGVKNFSAVVNPPHATILAVGAGEQRAVVKNGAVAVATVMTVTLSTDHRAVDGALGRRTHRCVQALYRKPDGDAGLSSMASTHTILCYGDSLTWGTEPGKPDRHPREARWPDVLAASLGSGVEVITDGLRGRTTAYDEYLADCDRNGARTLPTILYSHTPLDLVILLLGSNDMKPHIAGTAIAAMQGMRRLVHIVQNHIGGPGFAHRRSSGGFAATALRNG